MRPYQRLRAGLAVAATIPVVVALSATPSAANPAAGFTAEALTPSSVVHSAKSPTSRLAQTDPSLLGRTDSTRVPVLVKLDYDSVATYGGEISGYPATSPAVTG